MVYTFFYAPASIRGGGGGNYIVCDRAFKFYICIPWCKNLSLVTKSRSFVKVRYQGHNFEKMAFANTPCLLKPVPNDKVLDWFKLKAFADDRTRVAENLKFAFERVENIVGKGENAGYQHFILFPQCFEKATYTRSLKVGIVW